MTQSQRPRRGLAETDVRTTRSINAIGTATLALFVERDFGTVTVNDILARADVGRTTFYSHFRSKHDALYSIIDKNFSVLDSLVAEPSPVGARLFPVTEFLTHAAASHLFVAALRRSGQMGEFRALCTGHVTRLITRRLGDLRLASPIPRPMLARMLAGSVMELLSWSEERSALARAVDADLAFHALARGVISTRP